MTRQQNSLFDSNDNTETLEQGEYLRRRMAMRGITASDLADEIDVHSQTLYSITAGKRSISANVALKLSKYFGDDPDVWLSDPITIERDAASLPPTRKRPAKAKGSPAEVHELPLFSGLSGHPTGILVDREIEAAIRGDFSINITPYNRDQIEPASLDLTIGLIISSGFKKLELREWHIVLKDEYGDPLDEREKAQLANIRRKAKETAYGRTAELEKLDSVHILARETVEFGNLFIADVGAVAHNAMCGLQVNHGFQIDPGYSGPMCVTAIQITDEPSPNLLKQGQKLVSLAIRKLHRAPDKSYQEDVDRKILWIGRAVDAQLKALFSFKQLGDGSYKATGTKFVSTLVDHGEDEVQHKAVSWLLEQLQQCVGKGGEPQILAAVRDALDSVTIGLDDVDALARALKITSRTKLSEAKEFFQNATDRQTLVDTLDRMGADIVQAMAILVPS